MLHMSQMGITTCSPSERNSGTGEEFSIFGENWRFILVNWRLWACSSVIISNKSIIIKYCINYKLSQITRFGRFWIFWEKNIFRFFEKKSKFSKSPKNFNWEIFEFFLKTIPLYVSDDADNFKPIIYFSILVN